jgi:DUF4097 and DUF4098 domain-containing protein YvlB
MHRNTVVLATLGLLLGSAPAAAQQDDQQWLDNCERQAERSSRAVHCEIRIASTPLAGGRLSVDAGPNGGVVVRGGAVSSVEISARVQVNAETSGEARALAQQLRLVAANGSVRTEGPASRSGTNWSVTYYITVPQRADLDISTTNGPVGVHDVTGTIRAETTNGPLKLERLAGDVYARTRNGPLTITLAGDRWNGAGLDAETVNGPVRLLVPDTYSAVLEIGTRSGPLSTDFAIPVRMLGRSNYLQTTLGSGGAPIRVVTKNGPFTIGNP